MERYITRGIANYLPAMLQQQLWKLVAQLENEQFKELEEIDYFHIFQFNMHNSQLYIKHKQERKRRKEKQDRKLKEKLAKKKSK
ncbi:DUF960 family protein [Staphylococcus sp. GDY8P121P]|uniref:DUF960 family protein n=1 Tax=Staphylococcus sp. GDY8P121P TaxID=2804157 RepID=UPI001AEC6DD9|nr:DUF960 family protein [Staphylococcus sp. GDY8P121P]